MATLANNSVAAPVNTSASLGGNIQGNALGNSGFGGFLGDIYGNKYGIPNPVSTAGAAISGNLGNLAGIYGLSTGADQAGAAGVQSEYLANLPNYTGMLMQATQNVGQELGGQVPADVQQNLQQAAAERGVSTGQGPGSPNSSAEYLRALGLTSLDLTNQGMQNFNTLYHDTPTGPAFNPSSMFVTPEQQQAAQLAANQEAAAPDPALTGILSNLY